VKQRGPGGDKPLSRRPGTGEGAARQSEPAPTKPKIDKASANDQALDSIIAADKREALKLAPVSHETEVRLDRYIALLREWQSKTNLVAPSTLPNLWTRHIADSLQLVDLAPSAKRWADLGSGGGFPGVVLACVLAETSGSSIHLVERIAKKAAFLREAIRVTTSPGVVLLAEIGDNVDRITGPVDCVTARALAPLDELLKLAYPLLRNGALGLFPKGQDVEAELTKASKSWNIEASLVPSKTNPGSRIVAVTKLRRRSEKS